jgi:hypothetical protein
VSLALELVALAAQAAQASPPVSEYQGIVELAKVLGGGAAGTFAALAFYALRTERTARKAEQDREARVRADRQRELDGRLERLLTTVARLDERTALLVRDVLTTAENDARSARARARTPAQGIRTGPRKGTESDQ